jgi:ribosomal protein S27AE
MSRPSKPTTRESCGECHDNAANSPKDVPRVDIATHGERYVCWQCHYPHFPELE